MNMKRIIKFCVGLFVTTSLCTQLVAQETARPVTQPDGKTSKNLQLKVRATLRGHERQVFSLAFSPNGEFLATASDRENATRLWSTATGQLIAVFDGIAPRFSPDSHVLLTISDKTAKLWNSTGKLKLTLTGHEGNITAATFSPDGTRLATGSEDGTVKVWNANTGQASVTLTVWKVKKIARYRIFSRALHIPEYVYVKFSPDQHTVLTNTFWEESSAKLWDVTTGRLQAELVGPTIEVLYDTKVAGVNGTDFSPDGKFIAAQSDYVLRLWDAASGKLIEEFKSLSFVTPFSPDSRWLGVVRSGNDVGLFNLENLTLQPITGVDWNYVSQLEFSPDNRTHVIGSGYEKKYHATLIDIATGDVRAKIPLVSKWGSDIISEYQKEADILSFHPSSKFLMGANHSSVKIWDVSNGELVCETAEGRDPAQFSPDGRLLATVSKDKKTVLLWELVSN
jgi:WD40 repeat protein